MKPHRIILPLLAPVLAGASLCSCDDVDQDNRIVPVDKIESERVVIVQEFSGQNCSNCPDGAAALKSLMNAYPDNVVVVSMHPKGTAFSGPASQGLTSDEATVMYSYFDSPVEFPCAYVDGLTNNNNPATWATDAIMRMLSPMTARISSEAHYDAATDRIVSSYTVDFVEETERRLNVMVWLIESDIVALQNDHGTLNPKYVHEHVLRGSLNGDFGEEIGSSFLIDQQVTGTGEIEMQPKWNPANCEVVTYLYDQATREVFQADMCHVELPDGYGE